MSRQIRSNQVDSGAHLSRQSDQNARLLSDILTSQSVTRDTLHHLHQLVQHLYDTNNQQRKYQSIRESMASLPAIEIRTWSTAENRPTSCQLACKCRCHISYQYRSPNLLQRFVGVLFVGYAGFPGGFSRCSIKSCEALPCSRIRITYMFPFWLFCGTVISMAIRRFLSRVEAALTIARVVPKDALIFHYANNDNFDGLRYLLNNRLARPNDIQQDSEGTLLDVSLSVS